MARSPIASGESPSPALAVLHACIRQDCAALARAALDHELRHFLRSHASLRTAAGERALVRNGFLPARRLRTVVGDIAVQVPRLRDRRRAGLRFHSALLYPYLRRARQEPGLPACYLEAWRHGDGRALLQALFGPHALDLPPSLLQTILTGWEDEFRRFRTEALLPQDQLYWWGNVFREDGADRFLFLVGLNLQGRRQLLAVQPCGDSRDADWDRLFAGLRQRGLHDCARLACAPATSGFWTGATRHFPALLPAESGVLLVD